MDPQTCTSTAAVLGSAGTLTVDRDFTGAPLPNTWYCQALANSKAGTDPSPAFRTSMPRSTATSTDRCRASTATNGTLGYDSSPSGGDIDFISVVTHEIGHGLGFQTFVNSAGNKFMGFNDQYMVKLDLSGGSPSSYPAMTDAQRASANIGDRTCAGSALMSARSPTIPVTGGLNGGHIRVFAPNPYQNGSSVSHFHTLVTPNQLMEPSYRARITTSRSHSSSSVMKGGRWRRPPL